jgi:hypothetical protein
VIVIEAAGGLTDEAERLAAQLGPSRVGADAPLVELVRQVGLSVVNVEDVTGDFRKTLASMSQLLDTRSAALRSAEGSDAYEAERDKKARMSEGVACGILRRTLVVAEKPYLHTSAGVT